MCELWRGQTLLEGLAARADKFTTKYGNVTSLGRLSFGY